MTSFRVSRHGPAKFKTQLSPHEDAISKPSCTTMMNEYSHSNIDDNFDPGGVGDNDLFDNESSRRTFKDRKGKEVEQWALIRSSLLNIAIEHSGMHFKSACSLCFKTSVNIRCQSCGPSVYYCSECLEKSHENCNQTHTPEIYQVRMMLTSFPGPTAKERK